MKDETTMKPKSVTELSAHSAARSLLLDAVINASFIQDKEKAVYKYLFEHGPVGAMQIEQALGFRQCRAQLSTLRQRGMIKETEKAVPENGSRRVKLYHVTGAPPVDIKTSSSRIKKTVPTPSQIQTCAKDMMVLMASAHSYGVRIPLVMRKVQKWLADGAPCDCNKFHSVRNPIK